MKISAAVRSIVLITNPRIPFSSHHSARTMRSASRLRPFSA